MYRTPSFRGASFFCAVCLLAALAGCTSAGSAPGGTREGFLRDKETAYNLVFVQHKPAEALPILEKLSAEDAEDRDVMEMLAICLTSFAPAMAEGSAEKQKALIRSRELAEKAKKKGATNPLLEVIMETVPVDGKTDAAFSGNSAADATMKLGEAHFARADYQKALEAYMTAEALDPMAYFAPLYAGDCYFAMKRFDEAGKAYARAVALDPDKETAYRYWGNVLMEAGRMEEAQEKFIEAIVAEPYNRFSWNGIAQWAARSGKRIGHFKVTVPVTVSADGIVVDEKAAKDEKTGSLWLAYALQRNRWRDTLFAKRYPSEKQYRHSLAEECDAIRTMIAAQKEILAQGTMKLGDVDSSIRIFMDLDIAGLLEPYVLFGLADEGIAKDYEAYRAGHREALKIYLAGWAVHDS